MKNRLLILSTLFLTISCSSQENGIEKELKNCVKQELKDYNSEIKDFYNIMTVLENKMIEKGIIKNNSKKSYMNLLESISIDSKETKEFYIENTDYLYNNFPFNIFIANDIIFNQCPYKVYSENKKQNEKFYNQGKLQYEIMESGFNNLELNKKLIKNFQDSDFEKIVYRAPVIELIMINLDLKFNPDLKNLEEYKKNRKFLNRN